MYLPLSLSLHTSHSLTQHNNMTVSRAPAAEPPDSPGRCPRSACSPLSDPSPGLICWRCWAYLGARGVNLHDASFGRQLCLQAATGSPALTAAGT